VDGALRANNSSGTARLAELVLAGDSAARDRLFARHHDRLKRMVDLRLDRRLQGRVDVSDVVRAGFADAVARLPEYTTDPNVPLFLWLRRAVGERLVLAQRLHLGANASTAEPGVEVSLYRDALPAASSAALAAQLLGKHTSATEAAVRADRLLRVQEALNALDPLDREIIALRNFEELSRGEAARALGIDEGATAKRYIRAIKRLKDALGTMPGFDTN
jgi:RNA polymerase sigma-70 factor (ECF subfamily)